MFAFAVKSACLHFFLYVYMVVGFLIFFTINRINVQKDLWMSFSEIWMKHIVQKTVQCFCHAFCGLHCILLCGLCTLIFLERTLKLIFTLKISCAMSTLQCLDWHSPFVLGILYIWFEHCAFVASQDFDNRHVLGDRMRAE